MDFPVEVVSHIFTFFKSKGLLSIVCTLWSNIALLHENSRKVRLRDITTTKLYSYCLELGLKPCYRTNMHLVGTNDTTLLDYIDSQFIDENMLMYAIKRKNRKAVEILRNYCTAPILKYAAEVGDIKIVKTLLDLKPETKKDSDLLHSAVKSGNVKLVKYLYKSGCFWNIEVFIPAVALEDIRMLECLFNLGLIVDNCFPPICAAKYGSLRVIKWMRSKGFDWNSHTCYYSIQSGNLELLNWLKQNCPCKGRLH